MLATLYDLEIVEDPAVRDWLDPPSENRHPFLKQAKAVFAVKDNVEAKKQVLCVRTSICSYSLLVCLFRCCVPGHACIFMIHNSPTVRPVFHAVCSCQEMSTKIWSNGVPMFMKWTNCFDGLLGV